MKIESTTHRLAESVSRAERISSRNPTLPALAGIYLKAEKNLLVLKSTNLDLGFSMTVPAKVEEPGAVLVPAQVLGAFLSSLHKDAPVMLKQDGETLEISSGASETVLKTLSVEDFPLIPELPDDGAFSMPAADLALGLRSVAYAAAVGSMKPELSSVSISYQAGALIFAATDSFRLAEKRLAVKAVPHFSSILIPQKNASEIVRFLEREDGDVSLTLEEHQAAFRMGGSYLASRTVDGHFPDYRQIIPSNAATTAVLLKSDLLAALKTSLVFSDSFNQLSIRVNPRQKLFEVESKNMNVGSGKIRLDAALEGENIAISVNHRYLTDCFQAIQADSVSLTFNGPGKAIVVRGIGDDGFLYLVMPMNR